MKRQTIESDAVHEPGNRRSATDWVPDPVAVQWLCVACACSVVFVVDLILMQAGVFDREEFDLYHSLPSSLGSWFYILHAVSLIGVSSQPHRDTLFIAIAVVVLLGLVLWWQWHASGVSLMVLSLAGVAVFPEVIRRFVAHPVPGIDDGHSFPSGHAMGAVCIFGAIVYLIWNPEKRLIASRLSLSGAVLLTGIVTLSALTFHYPSDILGGYALGGAWLGITISSLRIFRLRHRKFT